MDRRTYAQYCGLAHALDVVGERWTLLVVRNLLLGPLRYTELLRGLPGITTNLLAKRLQDMDKAGLIERVRASGADGAHAYRLTQNGAALEPVVHALGRWGWLQMGAPAKSEHRSFDYLMVALRRRYLGGASVRAELVADGVPYRVILTPENADLSRGTVEAPGVRVRASSATLARVFTDKAARSARLAGIEIEGDEAAWRTLLNAFALSDADMPRSSAVNSHA
jgi:DNA-binding HxlR family transcriptional regulator